MDANQADAKQEGVQMESSAARILQLEDTLEGLSAQHEAALNELEQRTNGALRDPEDLRSGVGGIDERMVGLEKMLEKQEAIMQERQTNNEAAIAAKQLELDQIKEKAIKDSGAFHAQLFTQKFDSDVEIALLKEQLNEQASAAAADGVAEGPEAAGSEDAPTLARQKSAALTIMEQAYKAEQEANAQECHDAPVAEKEDLVAEKELLVVEKEDLVAETEALQLKLENRDQKIADLETRLVEIQESLTDKA